MSTNDVVPGTKNTTRGTMKAITPYSDNSEKWHFKMEWCRKAGLSPYNELNWELAEQAFTQRYF